MVERVIDIAKRKLTGYDYEIFFLKNKKLKSESHNLKVDKLIVSEDVGFSIRVIKQKRQGFAYSTSFDSQSIEDTIEAAKSLCNISSEDSYITINDKLEKTKEIEYFDTFAVNLPVEYKIEKSIELEKIVRQMDDRIKLVRNSTFIENVYEKYIVNSLGLKIREIGTVYTALVSAVASDEKDTQIAWGYNSKRFLSDLDLSEIAREVIYNSTSLLGAGSINTKNMPVIFPPQAMVELLETFSPAFLGDSLVKGKTALKGKIGEKVASQEITIVDNGIFENGLASSSYDDDGIAKRKTVVVDKGIFKTFLHNLTSAKKSLSQTTGNSTRPDFKVLPSTGITNFYIESSNQKIDDILNSYDEIFYIIDLMGLHTADPISGNFSLGVNGLIISKGEVVKAIRGAAIAGNFLDILNRVVAVGDNIKFYGNVGSPTVIVDEMTIAGD